MRYRVALCGFSEFEYRAMHFSFEHRVAGSESQYDIVDALAKADFSVVDADSELAVKMAVHSGRVERAVFIGAAAPAGAGWHLQRPIDPNRILRALDELSARDVANSATPPGDPSTPATPGETAVDDDMPMLDEVAPPQADASSPAKAAARAAARRARLVSARAAPRNADPLTDVLVLDADEDESASLCTLLERFGFNAYSVRSIEKATEQLTTRPYAAIFLDIALDSAGLALLEQIQTLPAPKGHPPPAVLLVSAGLDPMDRVRAALAGIGAPLIKPLSRGTVARALEDRKVTLPTDARRV